MTDPLPDRFTARPATPDDAERVAALWNDRLEVTRGERPSTPERVLKTWDHPKFDLSTDSLLVFAPDGVLIGYAHVRDVKEPPVDVFAGYSVHPDHDEDDWLWDCLFTWMDAEARRVIPKAPADARIVLVAGASDEDKKEQAELERHGFMYNRTFRRMRTEFASAEPAPEPKPGLRSDGIRIRTVIPGEDDEALVAAYREAFAGHYGYLEQPFAHDLEGRRRWMGNDGFDASLWFLACEDSAIAGYCTCFAEAPGRPAYALIDELGVRPAWRRRGIAQALLLHAFDELRRRGIAGAVLRVDTENKTGAPALYARVGMESVHAGHTYTKELHPGAKLVVQ
jgi:mycothiol synthase